MSGTSGWDQNHVDEYLKRTGYHDHNAAPVAAPVAVPPMLEKELQAMCEALLIRRGYYRMTADNAARMYGTILTTPNGFFGHIVNPDRNPFLPDIFVFAFPNVRPPLLVELKTKKVFQPGQREMIENGMWKLAWTVEEFSEVLTRWEMSK
jgi:hypothetical protein